jgi:ABC-type Na+ efflux pump permease subunit
MRPILVFMLHDLRRRWAQPWGLLMSLAIPLAMAGMMALVFGSTGDEDKTPVLRVLVLDQEGNDSRLGEVLAGASQNPEAAKHLDVLRVYSREEGLAKMRSDGYAALLVLPAGLLENLLDGKAVELELLRNPAQAIMPIAAKQMTEVLALYLSAGVRLLGDDGPRLRLLLEGEGWGNAAGLAVLATTVYAKVQSSRTLLFPPILEVERVRDAAAAEAAAAGGGPKGAFNFMGWMYPGMAVMGLLFVALNQMRDLLREREGGTLRRMLASPATVSQVLLGKVLGVAAVSAIALTLLLAIGAAAFGIDWGSPLPLAGVSLLLVFTVTGFAALVLAVVRTERQADTVGGVVVMLMSLLGGSFFPTQIFPPWLQKVALVTLNYWAQSALRALSGGAGREELLPAVTVLAAIAVTTTLAGIMLLRRRHLRGAL